MESHGLQFNWKVIFINKWTIRLLGKAKPGKVFIKSNFESKIVCYCNETDLISRYDASVELSA